MSKQTVLYEVFETVSACANLLKKHEGTIVTFQIVPTKMGDYGVVIVLNGAKGDK